MPTITYLEMLNAADLRARPSPRPDLSIVQVPMPMPELNRHFYMAVGGPWGWTDRLSWSDADWRKYLDRPELQTWLITDTRDSIGYFELEKAEESVEIVYFGLLPGILEQGIGGWALGEAVRKAWAMGTTRVWVHTCDLDHPRALGNYLARGFCIYKTVRD